jgi:hypothetical protein
MADIIQVRRDTAANWTSTDPTLANGEWGWETDTDKVKVGDGATAWSSLSYWINASNVDVKVGVDSGATADYLGVAYGDGALRTTQNELTVTDGGNFITLGLADHNTARTALGLAIGTDVLAEQTIGIANDNLLEVDHISPADDDYAKFTANGLEGRSYAEVLSDIGAAAASHAMSTHSDEDSYNLSTSGSITTSGTGGLTTGSASNLGKVVIYDGSDHAITITATGIAASYQLTLPTTDGGANEFLQTNGSGVLTWASGGTGDVTAASNMTDHNIVRGDGGAKGVQTTGITIADTTDNVSGMGTLGCETITVANGSSINLQEDITFTGATTENQVKFPDNLEDAFSMLEGANKYITFATTNTEEDITLYKSTHILYAATQPDVHALEIEADAAGYGDIKALEIDYISGGIAAGEDEGIILLNINETAATGGDIFGLEILATEGSAGVYGMKVGVVIGPIHQDSGTFINPDTGTDNTTSTDVAAMIDGNSGTTTSIFENDDEYILIGDAAAFEEIEFIVTTAASGAGINPTFWYSTAGSHQFTQFTPIDGTDGFKHTGVVAWDASDLTSHGVNTDTSTYDIKIIRTRNSLGTTPILGYAKTAATTEYIWDKDGNVNIKSLAMSTVVNASTDTDKFLVLDGSDNVDFRTGANVLSDIGALATQTIGIADNNLMEVDSADAADDEYARFTASGLEGRTYAEVMSDLPAATSSAAGKSELAIASEVNTGTDTARAITPDALEGSNYGKKAFCIVIVESDTAVTTGNGTVAFTVPAEMDTMSLVDVTVSVDDKGITGTTNVQVRRRRAGSDADMLGTLVTLGDEFFVADGVVEADSDDVATGDSIYIDVDAIHSGTAPNGLSVTCTFAVTTVGV